MKKIHQIGTIQYYQISGDHPTGKRIDWQAFGPMQLSDQVIELAAAGYEITITPIGAGPMLAKPIDEKQFVRS